MDLPGAFVEPTILSGVSPAMRASHEERPSGGFAG
jgi:acyl-CoA reductase-like NAD-dependent aldehyde dehydrogenase